MFKINFKKVLFNFTIITLIFLIDRISKNFILKIAEQESLVDIYINPYLNFYLIWNKGIAFGLFSFDQNLIYNLITLIIVVISFIIIILVIKTNGIERYLFTLVFGGAISNLYDRIYYKAVPDFIDFHIAEYHWFVFNVADIFITLGIVSIILTEVLKKDK
ncbi:signal peptidase II [Candidatus Pelagibacter sp. Uisw_113]|uniref:signal peptidase II n=1 Tax=Candidatus Pelagibacter sp. Uisw_113 TaxID=3230994 RepID=UPI0039EA5FA2